MVAVRPTKTTTDERHLVVIGAGTAGTTVANRAARKLPRGWRVTVVDPAGQHTYQPGLLYVPFRWQEPSSLSRARVRTIGKNVHWVADVVEAIDPDARRVRLAGGRELPYDLLVIASGMRLAPEQTRGLLGEQWRRSIFDFYCLDGAVALRSALGWFDAGRIVVNIVEMPIKSPAAPVELLLLADQFFTERGTRDRVELVLVTPLESVLVPRALARQVARLLADRNVRVVREFSVGRVDPDNRILRSWDEREVRYDLLVTVPTQMGAQFVGASGLGDELAQVPTERDTLLATGFDNIFVLGDATDLPTPKLGSVAHMQSRVVVENVLAAAAGKSLDAHYDGHASVFVETGFGRALLIDESYEVEPLAGRYPLPRFGPLSLLKPTRTNLVAKHSVQWLYWNRVLPGRWLPLPRKVDPRGRVAAEAHLGV